jgi:hypothetical protein
VTPVLEEDGVKRIGSGQFIVEYCCYKDQRNVPKKDEKGKIIKNKKGWIAAKSLCPKELQKEINK